MLSDAHCHLDHLVEGYGRPEQVQHIVDEAKEVGLGLMVTCATDLENSKQVVEIANTFDEVYCMVGFHPWWIKDRLSGSVFEEFAWLARRPGKVVGIGEVGLDFKQNPTTMVEQVDALRGFIGLAREVGLPLNLHCCPKQYDVMVGILRDEKAQEVGGLIHGFQGDEATAKEFLGLGFYLSLGHFLFWPGREGSHDAVRAAPMERLLLETDSPVGPEPDVAGRPALAKGVAEKVSALLDLPLKQLAETTYTNLRHLLRYGLARNKP